MWEELTVVDKNEYIEWCHRIFYGDTRIDDIAGIESISSVWELSQLFLNSPKYIARKHSDQLSSDEKARSKEYITWCYRILLGRQPESETCLNRKFQSLDDLLIKFMESGEYKNRQELFTAPVSFDAMSGVFIELTSHCNLHCKFCPSDYLQRKHEHMRHDRVLKILDELKDSGKTVQFHTLGEPLLNPHLIEYLRLCDEYTIEVALVTNLTLMTPEITDAIFSHPCVKRVAISMHTLSERSFALRGAPISFTEYLNKLKQVIFSTSRIHSNAYLEIFIMNDYLCHHDKLWNVFDINEVNAFFDLMESWNQELFDTYPMLLAKKRESGYFPNCIRNRNEIPEDFYSELQYDWMRYEFSPCIFLTNKVFGTFGMDTDCLRSITKDSLYIPTVIPKRESFVCPSAKNWLVVLSNGAITFCCIDYEGKMSVGNIDEMSLHQAAQSETRERAIKNTSSFMSCRTCLGHINWVRKSPSNK